MSIAEGDQLAIEQSQDDRLRFAEAFPRTAENRVDFSLGSQARRVLIARCQPRRKPPPPKTPSAPTSAAVSRSGCAGSPASTAQKRAAQETLLLHQEIAHAGRVSTMGQLASALAHEINQPLGAILRNAEAAELFMKNQSPDLDEIRAILADIRKDDQCATRDAARYWLVPYRLSVRDL